MRYVFKPDANAWVRVVRSIIALVLIAIFFSFFLTLSEILDLLKQDWSLVVLSPFATIITIGYGAYILRKKRYMLTISIHEESVHFRERIFKEVIYSFSKPYEIRVQRTAQGGMSPWLLINDKVKLGQMLSEAQLHHIVGLLSNEASGLACRRKAEQAATPNP